MSVFPLGAGAQLSFYILLEMAGQSHSIWHRPQCQARAGYFLFLMDPSSAPQKTELGSNLGPATY